MARSRITGDQIVDADVLSEEEHDAWIHKNLVCSGTVTFNDTPVMISGTGDIHCKDLYAANNSLYLGTTKISSTAQGGLLVDDSPVQAEATVSGYTGIVPVITSVTFSGSTYTPPPGDQANISFDDGTAMQMYLVFENGLLTTYSGGGVIQITTPSNDSLLSIM